MVEERDGGFSYYRAAALAGADAPLTAILQAQFDASAADPAVRADEARLQEVLRLRKENFDAHAGPDTRDARQLVPGRSWAAWSRALGLLMPPVKVADLGCGEGYLTIEAARWASRVVAVDRSRGGARRAPRRSRGAVASRTSSGRKASSRRLPMKDASVDVAMLSQALHHAHDPARAVAEAARVTDAGRPRAAARSARARRGVGARQARRPAPRLRTTTSCGGCSPPPGWPTSRSASARARRAIRSRC